MEMHIDMRSWQWLGPRTEQQDRYVTFSPLGTRQFAFAAVLDGAGGTCDGGRAADRAVARLSLCYLQECLFGGPDVTPQELLRQWLQRASFEVACFRGSYKDRSVPAEELPAATVVCALLAPSGEMAVGWAGDSVAILVDASGGPHLLTPIHNGLEDPAWLARHPDQRADHITRYLGRVDRDLQPEVVTGFIQPGEAVLLASDGAWGALEERASWSAPEEMLRHLTNDALADNATAVLIRASDGKEKVA